MRHGQLERRGREIFETEEPVGCGHDEVRIAVAEARARRSMGTADLFPVLDPRAADRFRRPVHHAAGHRNTVSERDQDSRPASARSGAQARHDSGCESPCPRGQRHGRARIDENRERSILSTADGRRTALRDPDARNRLTARIDDAAFENSRRNERDVRAVPRSLEARAAETVTPHSPSGRPRGTPFRQRAHQAGTVLFRRSKRFFRRF